MAKRGISKVVPRVRFPEFRNGPEWELRELGPMTSKVGSGITPLGGEKNYKTEGRPFIRSQNVGWGELLLDDVAYIDEETHRTFDSTEIEERDVLLNITGASIGRSVVADSRIAGGNVNQHVCIIRVKPNDLNPALLNQYLTSDCGQKQIDSFQAGGNRQGLNFAQIRSFEVPVALLEREQQKIADCLTSLDEVITAQGRKVEALKAHKRGLMQQLFPREGETRPRLRFPEFRSAPEWKLQLLDGFIEEFREKSKSQDEYEVLTSARYGLVRQREYYDNERITERDNIGFNVIPPNYMTYRSRSDDRRFYFNENDLGITGIISTYYPVFQIREGSNKFFVDLLSQYAELVGKRSVGTSQTVLSLNELRRIKLPIPTNAEQQMIAGSFASLDIQIAFETDQLAALKTHKQGLMQQLFPALETTGA